MITQKTQYALRAIFELGRHYGEGPLKISAISREQAIPLRFLEVILNKLKKGGFVKGKRGFEGGYFLIRRPEEIRLIDIIRQMDEPIGPVRCLSLTSPRPCPLKGSCAFYSVWQEVRDSALEIFRRTTIRDLIERHDASTDDGPIDILPAP